MCRLCQAGPDIYRDDPGKVGYGEKLLMFKKMKKITTCSLFTYIQGWKKKEPIFRGYIVGKLGRDVLVGLYILRTGGGLV